jgi:hypothetical protein
MNKLEFSSLIDSIVWIPETIGVVWFSQSIDLMPITLSVLKKGILKKVLPAKFSKASKI